MNLMYAVVEIAGVQYKVAPKDIVVVPTLKGAKGDTITLKKVLLLASEKQIIVGNPVISGVSIEAKILGSLKGEKVAVFKKKKRKGYRVKRGHRQGYTQLQILNIAQQG